MVTSRYRCRSSAWQFSFKIKIIIYFIIYVIIIIYPHRPANIGSYYRIKVAAYNRAGPGTFSATSHPPVQIPNRNQFIAMKAERKRKEDHDKLIKSLEEDDDEDD